MVWLSLSILLAQPPPFHSVKHPEVNPVPWNGDETIELLLTDEARIGPPGPGPTWKREAAATLKVRKTDHGFALTLRRSKWWSGTGPWDCQAENLVHAQDQDVTLDENGYVTQLTIHPPPPQARQLASCPDGEQRATALWNTVALLSSAAKQLVFSHQRTPMPALGHNGFVDRDVSYMSVACVDRTPSCRLGIVADHYQADGPAGPLNRTIDHRMVVDPDGRVRYLHRSRQESGTSSRGDLAIRFRRRTDEAPRPREGRSHGKPASAR